MKNLNKVHNLAMNCENEIELNNYMRSLGYTIDTKLAGKCTKLPIYYFKASNLTGMKQDRNRKWYTPTK